MAKEGAQMMKRAKPARKAPVKKDKSAVSEDITEASTKTATSKS
jgi:hypothetical protein